MRTQSRAGDHSSVRNKSKNPRSTALPSHFTHTGACRRPRRWAQGSQRPFPQPLRHGCGLEPGILAASLQEIGSRKAIYRGSDGSTARTAAPRPPWAALLTPARPPHNRAGGPPLGKPPRHGRTFLLRAADRRERGPPTAALKPVARRREGTRRPRERPVVREG